MSRRHLTDGKIDRLSQRLVEFGRENLGSVWEGPMVSFVVDPLLGGVGVPADSKEVGDVESQGGRPL